MDSPSQLTGIAAGGDAERFGRDPARVKVLPGIVPIIGSTEAEAQRRDEELANLQIPAYGLRQLSSLLGVEIGEDLLDEPLFGCFSYGLQGVLVPSVRDC